MPRKSSTRLPAIVAATIAGVAGVGLALWIVSQGSEPAPATTPTPTPTATATSAAPSPAPTPTSTFAAPEIAPGELVVTATGPIPLFDAAGDEQPADELSEWSLYGSPTTLLGFSREDLGDGIWIEVELVGAPNHRRAWVREADVEVSSTPLTIHVYLDERELELVDGDVVVLDSEVVIGAEASPTPLGTFWVTDPLDFSANPSGVYGAFALGINGYSETLEEFNGGPPQIAVHGTNQPDLLGQAVSNGCIRVPNDVATALGEAAPVGTPVIVHQSRDA